MVQTNFIVKLRTQPNTTTNALVDLFGPNNVYIRIFIENSIMKEKFERIYTKFRWIWFEHPRVRVSKE